MASLQQMCRGAWSIATRASVYGSAIAESSMTSSTVRSSSAARSLSTLPNLLAAAQPWQQLRAVTSLLPLSRSLHSVLPSHDTPSINPLQQTPSPPSSRLPAESDAEDGLATAAEALTARAILRNVPISPQKLNDFARMLRGLHIEDAFIQCSIHPKKSAKICEKVLRSAQANATNNHGLVGSKLKVEEAWVGRGRHLKRIAMHARGRAGKKYKYRSHLTIVLKEEETQKRTRVLPMLQERKKWWDIREGKPAPDNKWWKWWGKGTELNGSVQPHPVSP